MLDALNLIIFRIPPSANDFMGTGNTKQKNYVYQRIKKEWCELVFYTSRQMGWKKDFEPYKKASVEIKYFFPDNVKRDPDNYAGKFINDGLVTAGIIINDTFENIDLRIRLGGYNCKPERTEISVVRID